MRRTLIPALVAVGAMTGTAAATSLDIQYLGVDSLGTYHIRVDGSNKHVYAGRMTYRVDSGSHGSFTPGTSFYSFCVDLDQLVKSEPKPYDVHTNGAGDGLGIDDLAADTGGMGETRAKALSYLFLNHFEDAVSGSDRKASAFQLAVWEIIYEGTDSESLGTLNINQGDFKVTGGNDDAIDDAQDLLDEIAGLDGAFGDISNLLVGFGSTQYQDQLTLIPLPAPVLMGLAGFGLAAVARRRMRKG